MNKLLCKIASLETHQKQNASYKRHASSIFVKDLCIDMHIGVYPQEKQQTQPVRINIEAKTDLSSSAWRDEDLSQVTDYDPLVSAIRNIAQQGHIDLVETFADMIAQEVMNLPFTTEAIIKIEKLAIFEDAKSAGVELHVVKS